MAQKDTQKLAEAASSGNWDCVKTLLSGTDMDAAKIERCLLLHKLASDTKIRFSLMKDIVYEICSRQVNLLLKDNNGHTAVMVGAMCNNWEVVRFLCGKSALPKDTESVIAFLQTIGRSEDLKKSYKLSYNVLDGLWNGLKQRKPDCQLTTVHSVLSQVGAKLNSWWLVRHVFSTDIDLNLLDEDGLGVIHRLANGHKDQHVSLLLKFLDKGADINLRNVVGDTAVHIAAKHCNWRMVEALLQHGARADIANNERQTLLHILAVSFPTKEQLRENFDTVFTNFDTVFTLLQKVGVNIDAADSGGNTALHLAIKEGKRLVAEKLIDIGARTDVVDDNGRTVLHTVAAQEFGDHSLLTRLIERGADLETRDSEGNTALQLAVKADNWLCIHKLEFHRATERLYAGVDKTLPYELCLSLKDPNDLLHWAVEYEDWETVVDLVKKGTNINNPDSTGITVIQKLAQLECEHAENIFGFMVNRGANVNVRNSDGDNLLHLAAKNKNWLVVKRLIKLGFSAHEPDSEGLCLLHRLAEDRKRNPTFLSLLLPKVAPLAVSSDQSPCTDSLLHSAAKYKNLAMVEYLVHQADRTIINQ